MRSSLENSSVLFSLNSLNAVPFMEVRTFVPSWVFPCNFFPCLRAILNEVSCSLGTRWTSGICALIQASAGLSENSIVCQRGGQSNRITATLKPKNLRAELRQLSSTGGATSWRGRRKCAFRALRQLRNNSLLVYHSR